MDKLYTYLQLSRLPYTFVPYTALSSHQAILFIWIFTSDSALG